jgi:hypothetical protein
MGTSFIHYIHNQFNITLILGIYTLASFLLFLLVASSVQHIQLSIGHPFRTAPTPITNELMNKNGPVIPEKTFYTNLGNDVRRMINFFLLEF